MKELREEMKKTEKELEAARKLCAELEASLANLADRTREAFINVNAGANNLKAQAQLAKMQEGVAKAARDELADLARLL